jgi:hypothetical protein
MKPVQAKENRKAIVTILDETQTDDVRERALKVKESPLERYTLEGRLRAADWDGRRWQLDEIDWGPDVGKDMLPILACVKSFFLEE